MVHASAHGAVLAPPARTGDATPAQEPLQPAREGWCKDTALWHYAFRLGGRLLQHNAIRAMHLRHRHGNIPIELLRSFVAISRRGSFTKAAAELDLTQPAISAQIKRLQRHVGGDLFVKNALGAGLSELGRRVERYARRILALNDQIIAIAGQVPKHETINLGIQSAFAGKILADLLSKFPIGSGRRHRLICGSAPFLTEKLDSGYIDLAFVLAQTESRRNLVAEWNEKIVWICARQQIPLAADAPIPFVSRDQGFIDSKVLEVLDDHDVPYQIVFSAADLGTLAAAVEAGIGIMVAPERVIPEPLIIADDRILPKLPELRAGIFCKEGFDLKRNRALVEAFVAAVQPTDVTPKWVTRRT
jgi:DNA-binding transcriptional LysR family regulator